MPPSSSLAGLKPHMRPTYFLRTLSEWAPGSRCLSPPESQSCCVQRFRHLAIWLREGQWLQELKTYPWSLQEAIAMTLTGGRSQVDLDIIELKHKRLLYRINKICILKLGRNSVRIDVEITWTDHVQYDLNGSHDWVTWSWYCNCLSS